MASINSKRSYIFAGAVNMETHLVASYSPFGPLVSLYASGKGICSLGPDTTVADGVSTATAIITGLVVEMLSCSKVRDWSCLDSPEDSRYRERNLAKRLVAEKDTGLLDGKVL